MGVGDQAVGTGCGMGAELWVQGCGMHFLVSSIVGTFEGTGSQLLHTLHVLRYKQAGDGLTPWLLSELPRALALILGCCMHGPWALGKVL